MKSLKIKNIVRKWIGIVGIILLWQLLAMLTNKNVFPPFFTVISALVKNIGVILIHTFYSSYRLFAGVILAVCIGMPTGIIIGYFKRLSELLSPVIYLIAPIPKIALLPLIMLFFGIGDSSKIFIIFIIMFFQVVVAAHDAVKNISEDYFVPFRTVKAGHRAILLQIVFPAALPEMFTSIRIGLATGISVLFFAETFGTVWGLGFYIMDMWMRLDYTRMYAGIIVLGLLGLLSVNLVNRFQMIICPWIKTEKL
ncbi:MAG: binding-protein-dependent transport system inner rane component [Anaerocolumna sp.]|nr:binding-protein-dependent transport system inner rane component [Anaerocolumna sp.]